MIPAEKLRELAESGEKVKATYIVGKIEKVLNEEEIIKKVHEHGKTFLIPHASIDLINQHIANLNDVSKRCHLDQTLVHWAITSDIIGDLLYPTQENEEQAQSANEIRKDILDMATENLKKDCSCKEK